MTNKEWHQLLQDIDEKIELHLGCSFGEIELDNCEIPCCLNGILGNGMSVDKVLKGAASFQPTRPTVVTVRKLSAINPPKEVDLRLENIELHLTSFGDLAKYLLLHELAHKKFNHAMSGPAQEEEAEIFVKNNWAIVA